MLVDILMLSNVDWDIRRETKRSLIKYADDCRIILKIGKNWNKLECDQCEDTTRKYIKYPSCDKYKEKFIKEMCWFDNQMDNAKNKCLNDQVLSNSVYVLDDDDVLMNTPESVPEGYDGIIYSVKYGEKIISDIDVKRIGLFFGYARCVFNKEWLQKSRQQAKSDVGLRSCFDVFHLVNLYLRGNYIKKDIVICNIDKTPRTMHNNKYRRGYGVSLNLIRRYFDI